MTSKENSGSSGVQPLVSSLFTEIRRDIMTGILRPGQKLTEKRICTEYNVSRTPVREALRQLEQDGLIETIPNRGAFVIGFSNRDIDDLYTLRAALEIQAVRWAVDRITDEEYEHLRETFSLLEFYTRTGDLAKITEAKRSFMQTIYEASHNHLIKMQLFKYTDYLHYVEPVLIYEDSLIQQEFEELRDIFNAFTDKDIIAGEVAMKRHNLNSRARRAALTDRKA